MYGSLIIAYLFLGGTAAGGFFMMSACDLIRLHAADGETMDGSFANNLRITQAFESFRSRMHALCLLLLALSMLFLFWDLGIPERALYIFLHPHATILTFGSISLVAELVVGGLLTLGSMFRIRALCGRFRRLLNIVCLFTSIATMAYTGAFLMSNIGIAFWNTWTIVALFVSSSLSCGTALILLAGYFSNEQLHSSHTMRSLQKCHLIFIAAETISLALFLSAAFTNVAAANACEMLLSPDMLATAVIGVLGFSLIIPATCEGIALLQKRSSAIPVADVFCLCGGCLLRFCIISCGVY